MKQKVSRPIRIKNKEDKEQDPDIQDTTYCKSCQHYKSCQEKPKTLQFCYEYERSTC